MTLCRLMQMHYHGQITDEEALSAYDEYDLNKGIIYCEGYLEAGLTWDRIGRFEFTDFMAWCKRMLCQRSGNSQTSDKTGEE